MSEHLPVLIVLVPLAAALTVPLAGLGSRRAARGLCLAALLASHATAVAALVRVLDAGTWHYRLGGWAPPWGIEYVLDPLGGGLAVLVSAIAMLGAVYAGPFVAAHAPASAVSFHALYLLLDAGLLGMTVTGDLFNLYVFLEIAALSGYALLAIGGDRARVAVFRYLLVGTVAATFYLLGIGYLYAATGSLNMADVATRLPSADPRVLPVAAALMVVGLAIKAGLFPVHGWMPDVYACGPDSVVPFVAAVGSKVAVYAIARVLLFVLAGTAVARPAGTLLAWAGGVAILAGSAMALAQTDVRRMLAYSSVGQMGYIALGLGLGTPAALVGAALHVVHHAAMKGCLFMVTGGLHHSSRARWREDLAGMGRRAPVAMACFAVAALSLIGLPPFGGFFAKLYLVLGSLQAGAWGAVAALALGSLMSAGYLLRILETAYLHPAPDGAGPAEPPGAALVPAVLLAASAIALGLFNQPLVDGLLGQAFPKGIW